MSYLNKIKVATKSDRGKYKFYAKIEYPYDYTIEQLEENEYTEDFRDDFIDKEIISSIAEHVEIISKESRMIMKQLIDDNDSIEKLVHRLTKDDINENPTIVNYAKFQHWFNNVKDKGINAVKEIISTSHFKYFVISLYDFWEDQLKSMINRLIEIFDIESIIGTVSDLRTVVVTNPFENEVFSVLTKNFVMDVEKMKSLPLKATDIVDETMKQYTYKRNIVNYVKEKLFNEFEKTNRLNELFLANTVDEIFRISNVDMDERNLLEKSAEVLIKRINKHFHNYLDNG